MNLTDYALAVGMIVGNLQSLELGRGFLENHESTTSSNFAQVVVGQFVPTTAFSNYDSLGELVGKFNNAVQTQHPGLTVDPSVVELRDALAHGRVWADKPEPPLRLLKFGRPRKDGQVKVTYLQLMDENWLREQKDLVGRELQKVNRADQILHPNLYP